MIPEQHDIEDLAWMDDDDNTEIALRDLWWIPAGIIAFASICGLAVWG